MEDEVQIIKIPCLVQSQTCELILQGEEICLKNLNLTYKINLKTKIRWDISEKGIKSLEINNHVITADSSLLMQLKDDIDGRVIYLGISNYYETLSVISDKQFIKVINVEIQVCLVEEKLKKENYVCKRIRKDHLEIEHIHQSIQIQYKLQQYKQFPRLIEVYESTSHIYIIMEKLHQQLSLDFFLPHEEVQIIIYVRKQQLQELLQIVKLLVHHKIFYPKFKLSNLMIDQKGTLKLIGFTNAVYYYTEAEQYLERVGKIMLKLYGIKDSYRNLPILPDGGQSFLLGLMNPNLDYRFSLKDALTHEYIQNIFCETNITMKDTLIPKLMAEVNQHSQKARL